MVDKVLCLESDPVWDRDKDDEKRLEEFEMWVCQRMYQISRIDRVKNDEALARVGKTRKILETIRKRLG